MDYEGAIIITGAGAAGLAAAISSARSGAEVLLIEKTLRLGGTVTHSLIHSLGGIYDSAGEYLNDGLSVELVSRLLEINSRTRKRKIGKVWTLTASPKDFEQVMEQWISEESRINIMRGSSIASVRAESGKLKLVEIRSNMETLQVKPTALIDATGNSEIIRMINPSLVKDEGEKAGAGLVFIMRGVKTNALKFPKNVGIKQEVLKAVTDEALPPECTQAWIDSGVMKDEAYIKLHVPISGFQHKNDIQKAERGAHEIRDKLVSFLKGMPDFSDAYLFKTGDIGIRDGGRIMGEYRLTGTDVRELRKFEDPACRCYWPIEYWDQNTGVSVEYLTDGDYYEIPLRALKVKGMNNVLAVGKCLSADKSAQASARVVGCCWAMGEAAGKAISMKIK